MTQSRKRIVLKFGSGILAKANGHGLDEKQFHRIGVEVAALTRAGHDCIIVSSGAVAAGLGVLRLKERPTELSACQACAAVGQTKLMQLYAAVFAAQNLNVAQLLLTHGDLDSRMRHRNAKNTLQRLLDRGDMIPIINENDSVAVEELRFGDNDRLSAEVAMLADANLLMILTSVDGLMNAAGERIPIVDDIAAVAQFVRQEKGRLSVGGMITKLEAVKLAIQAGIPTVIANGRRAGLIPKIAAGKPAGTRFLVPQRKFDADREAHEK